MSKYIQLKESNCKNCYKCIRHCPTKSISFSDDRAQIISDECILCGQCFLVCPQSAKVIREDTAKVKALIASGAQVVASLAPSFVSSFPGIGISGMDTALKKLGFAAAEETAVGAAMVAREYDKMVDRGEQEVIISTCCSSVVMLVQEHFPELLPALAPVVSPMVAHCAEIKRKNPAAKTVFIGPCISKKHEGDDFPEAVDAALTFDELSNWFAAAGVALQPEEDRGESGRSRLFPTIAGILKSMDRKSEEYSYIAIDGQENCISVLRDISVGKIRKCFVEMSSCVGSCINGPAACKTRTSPLYNYILVEKYAGKGDFSARETAPPVASRSFSSLVTPQVYPNALQLDEILHRMGKKSVADELNCGSCGYNSCREKAIAVFQGKAEITMCTPYLRDKAETFSDNILSNSPNGILVLDDRLGVQQINPAALQMLNVRNASDVVGAHVACILDPAAFAEVLKTGHALRNRRIFAADYKRYFDQTVVLDKTYRMLLCILRDVTDEETERLKKEEMSNKTIAITDKVIEKQMRVVQEIASLLGETTAETKIALTKLKESLKDE